MSVHYKFKSALEYDTVTFDGLHISVKDLKNAILQQKRIGKSTDFDLQVTNAQTKEVYEDENALIPKNTSLLIARIPVIPQKTKQWEGYGGDNTPPTKVDEGGPIAKAVDLSSLDAPEDDKIRAMMSQSTQDYDPSNYMKIRGSNQVGAVPPNYKCYKCHQGGHWIKDCTFGQGSDPIEIKKSTGIPRSFMVSVEGPQVPGAMMTPNGQFAVPLVDHQAYNQKNTPAPVPEPKLEIPEELICGICSDLLTDAVMIPCCGNSFCDECIRGVLLESEDHECPDCHEKDISPDTLIPNRFLRTSVANFKNTTGYVKKQVYKEPAYTKNVSSNPVKGQTPPPRETIPSIENETEQKTVISEADSTESSKNNQTSVITKDADINDSAAAESESVEGPPGVSPRRSPKEHHRRKDESSRDSRSSPIESRQRVRRRSRERSDSPRRNPRHRRSPSFSGSGSPERRRSGTPTVDEPAGKYPPTSYSNSIRPGSIAPMMVQVAPIETIHGGYPPVQPPMVSFSASQGPPPTYRYPPPGPAPYLPAGPYNVPARPIFDATRPPLGGPPPNFNPNYPPGSRSHRDYGRRMLDRTPAGVIDDPLAAFNRLLREKDEQKRRAKQRSFRRSYSRSRSRSYSRSPPVRRRSRSPRIIRRSRSRSRSFSLSRSRSRSFSGSPRGSPHRQLSPPRRSPPPLNSRRGHSRYRSPIRSPPRSRHRDRDYDDDRDYNRDERPYKDVRRNRDNRDRRSRDRDRDRFYDNFDEKRGPPPRQQQWGQQAMPPRPIQENYYPPTALQQGYQTNRFGQGPPRDFGPPFMNKEAPFNQPLPQTIHSIQPQRQYQDIAPPGVDDDIAPPGVEEPPFKPEKRESPKKEEKERIPSDKRMDRKESDKSSDRKRRHGKRSRTPDKARNPSPKRKSKSRDRDRESVEKHRRRRRDSSDKEEKRRDHSDDERSKKTKDKKKHKDKKDSEKKKKRDKKEKHKKDGKDKKTKEEFKQIIPKIMDAGESDDVDKNFVSRKKREEEEPKLEGKRLDALEQEETVDALSEEQELDSKEKVQDKKKIKEKEDKPKKLEETERKKSIEEKEYTPEPEEPKPDLYGEISTEDIDTAVMENYGRIENEISFEAEEDSRPHHESEEMMEEGEIKEFDDEEKDVLELHTTDIDLKTELDKSDILAPVPEISKWEVDDDGLTSPKDSNKSDSKSDKSGKVTNEVLKRAENAIFAKAINAIRPIEIKKIGADRAKLYSGEREAEKSQEVTVGSGTVKNDVPQQPPVRLSVKERLGVKVDDTDKVINLSRRSKTVSPFSRRGESGRNYAAGERRVEVNENRIRSRRSRSRRRDNSRDRRRNRTDTHSHSRRDRRNDHKREKTKDEKSKHEEDPKKSKRKRSRSRSESEDRKDRHKKKDKKPKKEKLKKKEEVETKEEKEEKLEPKPQQVASKRKATIDEANFEPDYDESHSESEKDKKKASRKESDSSTSDSDSDSSSEEERRKKKHRKHKKRKKRETSSSSSSSSSETDSSESERDRKKRKHKKNKKKKKKSKHK